MVSTGVTRAYGADLRRVLGASTHNRFAAFGVGVGVTALLQSSTATALMITSFAGRHLVKVAPALAIMLGADVGTTLVVQVLSFDLSWVSPLLIVGGLLAFSAGQSTRQKDLGRVAIGLGLILLALKLILTVSTPLRESVLLQTVVESLNGEPVLALLIAALLTWMAHSSLAMVLLIISLVAAGVVPLDVGFALVLGANLGGTLPAIVATLGGRTEARRVALGNFLFKAVAVAVAVPFIGELQSLAASVESDPARQIANFHTGFNLALAAVFLFLTDPVARLAAAVLPTKAQAESLAKPRYLDQQTMENPKTALAAAARETLRMGDAVESMLEQTIDVFRNDDRKLLTQIERMDDNVDALYEATKLYLTELSRESLSESESHRSIDILTFATNLEHIGDIIDNNLMDLAGKKIKNRYSFSEEGFADIVRLHAQATESLRMGLGVFVSGDLDVARQLVARKSIFREQERAAAESHWARLTDRRRESIESSALHLDVLRDLRRINSHAVTPAYPILDAAGDLRSSRLRKKAAKKAGAPL